MHTPNPARGCVLLCLSAILCAPTLEAAAGREWPNYLGDKATTHFSTLAEITPENVGQLQVAWEWHGGGARTDSQIQCNPLMIDGVLYVTTAQQKLAALDAATGRELWRYAPEDTGGVNRGVSYWAEGDERRILFGSNQWLHAVDARTGKPIESFGDHGRVDLSVGLGRDVHGMQIQANTPGIIFRNLIILSTRVGEGPAPAAPGHIRAYDVRTGALVWTFHTIPFPGEPGYETWPADAYQHVGGVNVWAGMSLDEETGTVFCPVGSGTFDFWGGDRRGANLYADCLLALDAATGRRKWHFQFVHHDLWDRDPPAPPVLVTLHRDGQDIPAVAQTTKQGYVWVFRRDNGEPLFPIEEITVPTSDLAGELTWPTQPLPKKPAPFARQHLTADDLTERTPEAHRAVLERFVRIRPHARFLPPSREGTIVFPGFDGGAEWGGPAVDANGVLYVNANEMPWILTMIETTGSASMGEKIYLQNCTGCHGADRRGNAAQAIPSLVNLKSRLTRAQAMDVITHGRAVMPPWGFLSVAQREALVSFLLGEAEAPADVEQATGNRAPPYTHTGYNRWLDPDGYPAIKPPWGTLTAIDLNSGETRWQVPLGELEELTAKGIPKTGAENYGGPIVTASGLVFVAASRDEHIRAFETRTGREIWKAKLPAGGYATPATYEIGGRQYVVIACGGGKLGTKSGDSYVAFALPKK